MDNSCDIQGPGPFSRLISFFQRIGATIATRHRDAKGRAALKHLLSESKHLRIVGYDPQNQTLQVKGPGLEVTVWLTCAPAERPRKKHRPKMKDLKWEDGRLQGRFIQSL